METRTPRTPTGESADRYDDAPALNMVKVPCDPAQVIVDHASFRVQFSTARAVRSPRVARYLSTVAATTRPPASSAGARAVLAVGGRSSGDPGATLLQAVPSTGLRPGGRFADAHGRPRWVPAEQSPRPGGGTAPGDHGLEAPGTRPPGPWAPPAGPQGTGGAPGGPLPWERAGDSGATQVIPRVGADGGTGLTPALSPPRGPVDPGTRLPQVGPGAGEPGMPASPDAGFTGAAAPTGPYHDTAAGPYPDTFDGGPATRLIPATYTGRTPHDDEDPVAGTGDPTSGTYPRHGEPRYGERAARPEQGDGDDHAAYREGHAGDDRRGYAEDDRQGYEDDFEDDGEFAEAAAGADGAARGRERGTGAARRRGTEQVRHAYYPGRRMNLGVVLLPLRILLGFISLYAGMGKLCDPAYFDGDERGSLVRSLRGLHPWAVAEPLRDAALQHPVGAALTVAFLQVIVGVLTVLGLWQRLAAATGAVLAAAMLVTVSWKSVPGHGAPDIIYLAAWSPLIIAGAPVYSVDGRLSSEAWRTLGPRAALWELRRRVLRRGTLIVGLITGLTFLVGALLGGAVRDADRVTVPGPGEAPHNELPGSPLPRHPGASHPGGSPAASGSPTQGASANPSQPATAGSARETASEGEGTGQPSESQGMGTGQAQPHRPAPPQVPSTSSGPSSAGGSGSGSASTSTGTGAGSSGSAGSGSGGASSGDSGGLVGGLLG